MKKEKKEDGRGGGESEEKKKEEEEKDDVPISRTPEMEAPYPRVAKSSVSHDVVDTTSEVFGKQNTKYFNYLWFFS